MEDVQALMSTTNINNMPRAFEESSLSPQIAYPSQASLTPPRVDYEVIQHHSYPQNYPEEYPPPQLVAPDATYFAFPPSMPMAPRLYQQYEHPSEAQLRYPMTSSGSTEFAHFAAVECTQEYGSGNVAYPSS